MDLFATAPAFMAGYGIKCFFILQSLEQQAVYATGKGDPDPIFMNCDCQVYYTPNNHDTAHKLSQRMGKTTVIKETRNRSGHVGATFSISDSQTEVSRDLMTAREIMNMPKMHKVTRLFGKEVAKPGDALILCAGKNPIYAEQVPFFNTKKLQERTCITAPPL